MTQKLQWAAATSCTKNLLALLRVLGLADVSSLRSREIAWMQAPPLSFGYRVEIGTLLSAVPHRTGGEAYSTPGLIMNKLVAAVGEYR
jgi:hypothetical protein